jgi:hypothetical protein
VAAALALRSSGLDPAARADAVRVVGDIERTLLGLPPTPLALVTGLPLVLVLTCLGAARGEPVSRRRWSR